MIRTFTFEHYRCEFEKINSAQYNWRVKDGKWIKHEGCMDEQINKYLASGYVENKIQSHIGQGLCIRRFEWGLDWCETRKTDTHYEYRDNHNRLWSRGTFGDMEAGIKHILSYGFKEVTMAIDPNDLQSTCAHQAWDRATDSCAICGKDWNTISWQPSGNKPCCGGSSGTGPHYYTKGAWHQSDCLEVAGAKQSVNPAKIDFRPEGSKRGLCTCGSSAVGSDRHSDYCDSK